MTGNERMRTRAGPQPDHRAATGSSALWVKQALDLQLKDEFLPREETFDLPPRTGCDPSHPMSYGRAGRLGGSAAVKVNQRQKGGRRGGTNEAKPKEIEEEK